MADNVVTETKEPEVPTAPPDSENEAIIDAGTTFKITAAAAVLFGLAALYIILSTRIG